MKKFLILACLLSASAFGGEAVFNHTFFGNTGGRFTMVSCDYAEYVTRSVMTTFGATKIEAQCSGGITPVGIMPISLRVVYSTPNLSGPTRIEKTKVESDRNGSNCDFDTSLIGALLADFPNVVLGRHQTACFSSTSTYRYELSIQLPN